MITIRCETGEDVVVVGDTLVGANLSGLNLHRALLDGRQLQGANLSGAELRSAWIEDANLAQSNLIGASLAACNASRAIFSEANLTEAMMRSGNFNQADFSGANLRNAKVGGAQFTGAIFDAADLRCEGLDSADLSGIVADSRTKWPLGFDPLKRGVIARLQPCPVVDSYVALRAFVELAKRIDELRDYSETTCRNDDISLAMSRGLIRDALEIRQGELSTQNIESWTEGSL